MSDVTVVIPVGPYHESIVEQAIASCLAQTVPVTVVVVQDRNGYGAGWTRNKGLEQVETPLTVFLDADDTIAPHFVERCLSVYDGRKYIYTDHWQGDKLVQAPNCAWVEKTWHPISALVPTAWAREVGGFDAALSGGEDTDFFLKLVTSGHCGKRLPEPLFHYGADGRRGKAFVEGADYLRVMQLFTERYGRKLMACGDCGDSPNIDLPPVGEKQIGDVLAFATWAGNRQERGRATGRLYARSGNGKQMYVASADIDASPHLWRRVETTPTFTPGYAPYPAANIRRIDPTPPGTFPERLVIPVLDSVQQIGAALNDFQRAHFPALPPLPLLPVAPVDVKPDVAKVTALYKAAKA